MSERFPIAADQLRALSLPHGAPQPRCVSAEDFHRMWVDLDRRRRLRQVYDATPPREDLCDFDAQGMDVIEGRRA